jgi:hypothetical protein
MLIAIAAIIAVAFYYVYSAQTGESRAQALKSEATTFERLTGGMTLFVPEAMQENGSYRAAVYNTGAAHVHDLVAFVQRPGGVTYYNVTDLNGAVLTSGLPERGAGFINISTRPLKGDLLVVGGREAAAFHLFSSDVKRIKTVDGSTSAFNTVDGTALNFTDSNCSASNRYSWNLGVTKAATSSLLFEAYGWTNDTITFFQLDDEAGHYVEDSFDAAARSVMDMTNATWSGTTITICVKKVKKDTLRLDYLKPTVIY